MDWRRFPAARAFMSYTGPAARGVLLRGADPPRAHHQGWLRAGAHMHLAHDGGKAMPEAIVAVARELAGFVWAEMTA